MVYNGLKLQLALFFFRILNYPLEPILYPDFAYPKNEQFSLLELNFFPYQFSFIQYELIWTFSLFPAFLVLEAV